MAAVRFEPVQRFILTKKIYFRVKGTLIRLEENIALSYILIKIRTKGRKQFNFPANC